MKVTLYNIQGHAKSSFEIKEGINVIVGSTDSGKSTAIRGLKWLAFNKPAADALRRNGADKMYVEVVLDDGTVIRRENSKKGNIYILNGTVLRSFGTGVPMEVQRALNLLEYNFKFQHDGFFLLSSSGPERARTLNRFLNMDRITEVTKAVAAKIRETRSQAIALSSIEQSVKKEYLSIQPKERVAKQVLSLIEEAKVAEACLSEYNRVLDVFNTLNTLANRAEALKNEWEWASDRFLAAEGLMGQVGRLKQAQSHLTGLETLALEVKTIAQEMKQLSTRRDTLNLSRCAKCGSIVGEVK